MELPRKITETVSATSVEVHCKVVDTGSYTLKGPSGQKLAELDGEYVPKFFPGDHYGDYLILDIDLESGKVLNWRKPEPMDVAEAFNLIDETE